MQGADAGDPVAVDRGVEAATASLEAGIDGLRIVKAAGYFEAGLPESAGEAVKRVVEGLGVQQSVELPEATRARAAAYVITAAEGAALHLDRLRQRAADFDPAVRDRLIAGAMIPAHAVVRAQKLRRWYRERVVALFESVDIIVAPATPFPAPAIGQTTMEIAGRMMPLRPNIGLYTQPISFIGLPVVAVPIPLSPLPIGVQIIAPPWREDLALRVARHLERSGIAAAPRPREPF
jgi:aspartyl-tRNA(Asn)/glutamyl-tRNA(Gln) amidotransferase subunit A